MLRRTLGYACEVPPALCGGPLRDFVITRREPQRWRTVPLTVQRGSSGNSNNTSSTEGCARGLPALREPLARPSPASATVTAVPPPRYLVRDDYVPLPTDHPAFGQQQRVILPRRRQKPLLSTVHPAFGTRAEHPLPRELFTGPVSISGFFLAIDPNACFFLARREQMNPNAQLTISDGKGNHSRARYRCILNSGGGVKVEALLRFQVGWISPKATFASFPEVIHLGKGFDVSIPFLFHFTMVAILDENGCSTGSYLYFSGTPMLGLSLGYSVITSGKLVLNNKRHLDPPRETTRHFFAVGRDHKVHYRQAGFVVFKFAAWMLCVLAALPCFESLRWLKSSMRDRIPTPLQPHVDYVFRLGH